VRFHVRGHDARDHHLAALSCVAGRQVGKDVVLRLPQQVEQGERVVIFEDRSVIVQQRQARPGLDQMLVADARMVYVVAQRLPTTPHSSSLAPSCSHVAPSALSPCAPRPTDPVGQSYRLLTLCPAPTDTVGQSWPRGTGSVGPGAQGQ